MLKKIFRDKNSTHSIVAIMSLSNYISNAITIISGLFVAKLLMPSDLGMFNGFTLIVGYVILLQMGVPNGLSRQYTLCCSQNNIEKAEHLAMAANSYELYLGALLLFASLLAGMYYLLIDEYKYAAGSLVLGVSSFDVLYVTKYLQTIYRLHNYFNRLSLINIITSISGGLSIYFVWKYGFFGLCIRVIVSFLVNFSLTWIWKPKSLKVVWDWCLLKELLKVGLPIFWVSNLYSMWPILQRTFIIIYFGANSMGLYSLSAIVQNSMSIITVSLSNIVFPNMVMRYGKGHSVKDLLDSQTKLIFLAFLLNIIFCLFGWVLIPIFVEYFLPNYLDGVKSAQWMLLVGLVEVFTVYSNIYVAINRNIDRFISYAVGVSVWLVSIYLFFIFKGKSLEIVPQSILISYIAMYITNIIHYKKWINNQRI